jgi:hypothetical protein
MDLALVSAVLLTYHFLFIDDSIGSPQLRLIPGLL